MHEFCLCHFVKFEYWLMNHFDNMIFGHCISLSVRAKLLYMKFPWTIYINRGLLVCIFLFTYWNIQMSKSEWSNGNQNYYIFYFLHSEENVMNEIEDLKCRKYFYWWLVTLISHSFPFKGNERKNKTQLELT